MPGSQGCSLSLGGTPRALDYGQHKGPHADARLQGSARDRVTTPWGFPCCVRFPCVLAAFAKSWRRE
jgi:hypothetical protein